MAPDQRRGVEAYPADAAGEHHRAGRSDGAPELRLRRGDYEDHGPRLLRRAPGRATELPGRRAPGASLGGEGGAA